MQSKKVANDIKKEGVTGKINKITIILSGKEELIIYLNNKNEINKATMNGESFPVEKINDELLEKLDKLSPVMYVMTGSAPPCPWIIDWSTKQPIRLCLPGYVCY